MTPLIIIPARMAATRLPGKPLADIGGTSMIVHVMRRAQEAAIGPVVIACSETVVKDVVEAAGGRAVMTDPELPSGTDRVKACADIIDPDGQHDIIVNVQGDMPTLDPGVIKAILAPFDNSDVDMTTAAVATSDAREIKDPNVVKAVIAGDGRALYFTRASAPSGDGPIMHHLGLYGYRRAALDRFCALPPSPLERRERLEQLRALEDGMRLDVVIVDAAPHGVDTPDDLDRARQLLLKDITE
ncbi:3-deoxy-manno-octulosonate cytidylyltransferase [Fretibacter rubidus]|uniref:3-deoxy-manno-octulosonate cytidylyltransferase n=1 Tax=Fretibacter rubidus TaxID=570162 RepID=UPI00352A5BFE